MTSGTLVRGYVEDGWGKVADTFRANFEGNPGEDREHVRVWDHGTALDLREITEREYWPSSLL
ncbi:hypothetical protein [Ktedonospora formicarum]|uniref:Uncharacterized protein n=1 Tax=Ktedonospora formicarum TaxID=2778364 RepID=A0A8J3MTE5_9CHLR|nr:hypothetical protein [Ktedonospora formicarum]GHO45836.1 hypothetical protein KSX_39990 [Ktedonospora formicarum]